MLRRYVHGLSGGDDPAARLACPPDRLICSLWFEGSSVADSARRYLYADERGSIVAVTDSSGNVLNRLAYDEYGLHSTSAGDIPSKGRFRYTGQAWLPELGLFHYTARMYSPTLGRFMQTDPIGYGDGMNMYAYVHGDPVNGVDPSGLCGEPGKEPCTGPDVVINHERLPPLGKPGVRSYSAASSIRGPSGPSANVPLGACATEQTAHFCNGEFKSPANNGETPQNICPAVPASRPVGTVGEKGAAIRDPLGIYPALVARDQARDASKAAYPDLRGKDDAKDAFRHFYWVFAMTKLLGADRALAFANAHEAQYPPPNAFEARASRMDTYNNSVAASMASDPKWWGKPTADVAKAAIAAGCLDIIK